MDPRIPHPLLDTLIREYGLKNDRHLSEWLGIEPPNLSRLRAKKSVSPGMILRVYHRTKWPIERIEELCNEPERG